MKNKYQQLFLLNYLFKLSRQNMRKISKKKLLSDIFLLVICTCKLLNLKFNKKLSSFTYFVSINNMGQYFIWVFSF